MDDGTLLQSAIHARPGDDLARLAFADWLEETGQAGPAELTRLLVQIRQDPSAPHGPAHEQRLRDLLASGVRPVVPAVTNSIGMEFVLIPPGSFLMGSPPEEDGRFSDETPLHPVTLTRPFYLGVTPVTQAQYRAVVGRNPSHFSETGSGRSLVGKMDTSALPVENVTWQDAVAFCRQLQQLPAEKGRSYRLPTEAEWEYACRGGIYTPTPYHFGEGLTPSLARYDFSETGGDSPPWPCPVRSFPPNAYGLFDLHGNVWEYCLDWFLAEYYHESPEVDPAGPEAGDHHVLRGGSWYSRPTVCRSACRNPVANPNTAGFRVVLTAD